MCSDVLRNRCLHNQSSRGSYLSVNDGRRDSVVAAAGLRRTTPVLFPPNDLAFCVVPAS